MPEKETLWFKHDFDAHDDDKIVQMISKYKYQGYGWYWLLVEKMRGAADYKLPLSAMDAYAMRMLCGRNKASEFITDCIEIFKLFESDGTYFWSERLLRDMEKKNLRSEQARSAAFAKHAKHFDANAQRTHSESSAIRVDKSRVEKKREEKKNDSPIGESKSAGKIPSEYMMMIEAHTDNPELRKAICDWFLMRKAKGKKFAINTPRALQLNLNTAKRDYGTDELQIAAFNYATERGHQGLYYNPSRDSGQQGVPPKSNDPYARKFGV